MDEYEISIDETMASILSAMADAEDDALFLAAIGQVDPREFRKFMAELGEIDNQHALEILAAAEALHAPSSRINTSSAYSPSSDREARILIASELSLANLLRQNLVKEGYVVNTAATGAAAIEMFDRFGHPLIICDLQLPDMNGINVLRHIKNTRPSSQVIVTTAYRSVERSVHAMKAGAFWFLETPFDFDLLMPMVERALERHNLMRQTETMRDQLTNRTEYFNIIGASKSMQALYDRIESAAKSDTNVLIVGESGTGKELIANTIHYNSPRSIKPFITINCAALPKEIIESELFGHAKGAFTDARAEKQGLIQRLEGGSLFLKGIAEIPVELQPRLLRALEEGTYRKIGSEKTDPVDFRLISSIEALPSDAIRNGMLRDDLFYRMSTNTIHVPPLRERIEDIPLLAEHFLKMYARKYERPIIGISQVSYQHLLSHSWLGNVRELKNVIERAVLLAAGNKIELADLPFDTASLSEQNVARASFDVPANMTLEEIERLVIERTLQRTGGNRQAAANILGIYGPRLYSKIRKYNIDIDALSRL